MIEERARVVPGGSLWSAEDKGKKSPEREHDDDARRHAAEAGPSPPAIKILAPETRLRVARRDRWVVTEIEGELRSEPHFEVNSVQPVSTSRRNSPRCNSCSISFMLAS